MTDLKGEGAGAIICGMLGTAIFTGLFFYFFPSALLSTDKVERLMDRRSEYKTAEMVSTRQIACRWDCKECHYQR